MRVVCVSDTHGLHDEALRIPDGDVLVHAGDFTDTGARDEVLAFNAFLGRLPHRYKLVIAGNHEATFDRQFYPRYWHQYGHRQQYDPDEVRALLTNALYLEDEAVLIEGFLFYGSPWQPEFCNWAFNLPRGEPLRRKWRRIPSLTDVLVTHTPPMGHGDGVGHQHVGCTDLLQEVETRVHPRLHVFGHVHEGYGRSESADGRTTFFNASCCTHDYEPTNAPFVFELAGAPRRGWPQTKPQSHTSAGLGMRRSWSTSDVSCASSMGSEPSTEDDDVDMEDGEQETPVDHLADYALLFHERLRLCSQKVAFVDEPAVAGASTSVPDDKTRLREFRVDGTTSGMLFESTLKLRPVLNVQRRALRYLFSQGFTSNADNYHTETDSSTATLDEAGASTSEGPATGMEVDAEGGDASSTERRRVGTLSRRVTVAVLDDLSESKDMMNGPEREQLEQASVASEALGRDSSSDGRARTTRPRRGRRDKTLRRRSAVPKLAALTEEPAENSDGQTEGTARSTAHADEGSSPKTSVMAETKELAHTETSSMALTVPSAPVECVLCKYNVPGHVHPGAESKPAVPEPVTPVEEKKANTTSAGGHPRTMGYKRLSSWF